MTVDIADGRVHTVRSIINPAKLRHLGAPADISAVHVRDPSRNVYRLVADGARRGIGRCVDRAEPEIQHDQRDNRRQDE
jgi:hypothetical protein